jgi:hypothetical protein
LGDALGDTLGEDFAEADSTGAPAEEVVDISGASVEEIIDFANSPDEAAAFDESPAIPDEKNAGQDQPDDIAEIPAHLRQELKTVLTYMDKLLEALPEDKIEEFAKSSYFESYKKLFADLGLV